jgi:hypothetical protein
MHRLWNLPVVLTICVASLLVEAVGIVRDDTAMTLIPIGVTGLLATIAAYRLRAHTRRKAD